MSSHQPNWLINDKWLAAQDRLTRSLLIGRGIICGMEPSFDKKDCTLWLCGGLGLTSDGTLVHLEEERYHFTHYTPYDPPPGYALFQSTEDQNFPVWELLTGRKGQNDQEVKPLTPQNPREAMTSFLAEKVLIVFLEEEQVEPPEEPPGGEPNPDEGPELQPQEEPSPATEPFPPEYHLRFLLMRQQDILEKEGLTGKVKKIVGSKNLDADFVYSDDYSLEDDRPDPRDIILAQYPELSLAEIPLRRFGFGCLDPFDCEPQELEESQFPHIENLDDIYAAYSCIIDAATRALDREMRKLQAFLTSLFPCGTITDANEILDQLCAKWEVFKKLNTLKDTSRHRKEHVQYFYDWCRDLLAAYHELRQDLLDLAAGCGADEDAHPRHLFLGLVMHSPWAGYPNPFRHYFLQPPVYNGNAERLDKIRNDHRRFLLLIKNFYLPYSLPDQLLNPYCGMEEAGEDEELPDMTTIKVTPGYYYDHFLARQTIPYYYPLTESKYSVHRFWSYKRSISLNEDRLLSYHARHEEDSYTDHPSVIRPLRYNIDRMPFFRIEGHIGQDKATVDLKLAKWQRKYNLSFDFQLRSVDDLTEKDVSLDGETFNTFLPELTGAEHLAGVLAGGTFIVVYEQEKVIADFSLPYRCCGTAQPPDEPEEPDQDKEVTGRVVECINKAPLPGLEMEVSGTVIKTGPAGRFITKLPPGNHKMFIKADLYNPLEVIFEIKATDTRIDLGDILMQPLLVRVTGGIFRATNNNPMPGMQVVLTLVDGNTFESKTDEKGIYTFENVPRMQGILTYTGNGITGNQEVVINPPCNLMTLNDIIIGAEPLPFPNDFRAVEFLNERYYVALNIDPQSSRAKEVQAFYDKQIGLAVNDFTKIREQGKINELDGFLAAEDGIRQIINDPDLSTTQLHRIYKKAVVTLEEDIKSASAANKKLLQASAGSLNKLYLYRIAINQPDSLTQGTENALKESQERGMNMDKLVKEWVSEAKSVIPEKLLDDLNKLNLS